MVSEVTMQWVMQLREGPKPRLEGDKGVGPAGRGAEVQTE